MRRPRGFERHFAPPDFMKAILRWMRGVKKPDRFSDRPEWLKQELLSRAAEKREMRCKKRLQAAEKGAIGMNDTKRRRRTTK